MHIETYIIEETQELIYDQDKLEEWNNLVRELGLSGQGKTGKTEKSPIPFQPMNTRTKNILKELCPSSRKAEEYSLTPIPLEVLKLIALSKRENYFGHVEIWYDERSSDPVCVGYTNGVFVDNPSGSKQPQYGAFATKSDCEKFIQENNLEGHKPYTYGGEPYLIARWADVKQSFQELAERAKKIFVDRKTAELNKELKRIQSEISTIQEDAVINFG